VALAHLIVRDLFGCVLPARLQALELVRDRVFFEPVSGTGRLAAGDLVWFGVDSPGVDQAEFVPLYDGDELVNGGDFPVKHVAVCTGTGDGDDHIMLHASAADGSNALWPLRRFRDHARYGRIYAIRRLRPEFRLPTTLSRNYLPREYSWSILSVMSVPLTLLGLLERGPSHGYDLKRDYDAYFGRGRPLRYSQVYATLSRLARDGKAVAGPVEQEAGPERRRYVITEEGVADVDRWLAEPVAPEPDLQSELFAKVVLALMLDRPADGYLDAQRAAHLQRMRELTELKRDGDPLGVLLADHALYRLEADLRWIDHTAARLDLLSRAVRR